jgi:hypothetical protein
MPSDVKFTYRGVRITVLAGSYLKDGAPTEQAAAYYIRLFEGLDDLRQFAAEQLLGIYNSAWSDDDEPPMDQETFVTKLVNPAIVLYDDAGKACVYFDDSDLFGGHGIEITVEGATPAHANLVG